MKSTPPKTRRTVQPEADLSGRIDGCESELRDVRWQVEALRAELMLLTTKLEAMSSRVRQMPPPLYVGQSEEIISVDESHVTLESIRPARSRRPKPR
jgi:hypothetical protein